MPKPRAPSLAPPASTASCCCLSSPSEASEALCLKGISRVDSFLLSDESAQFEFDLKDAKNSSNCSVLYFTEHESDRRKKKGGGRDDDQKLFGRARRFFRRLSFGNWGGLRARSASPAAAATGASVVGTNYLRNVSFSSLPFQQRTDSAFSSTSCHFLDKDTRTPSPRRRQRRQMVGPSVSTPQMGKLCNSGDANNSPIRRPRAKEKGGAALRSGRSVSEFFQRISPSFLGGSERRRRTRSGRKSPSYDRMRTPPSRWNSLEDLREAGKSGKMQFRLVKSERDLPKKRRRSGSEIFSSGDKSQLRQGSAQSREDRVSVTDVGGGLPSAATTRSGALCGVASIWNARHKQKVSNLRHDDGPVSAVGKKSGGGSVHQVNLSRRSSSVSTDSFEGFLFEATSRMVSSPATRTSTLPPTRTPPTTPTSKSQQIMSFSPPLPPLRTASNLAAEELPYQRAADEAPAALYEVPYSTRLMFRGKSVVAPSRIGAVQEEELEEEEVRRTRIITNARAFMNMLRKEKESQGNLSRQN